MADAHADGAVDEEGSATCVVYEEECADGEGNEEGILNSGGYEVDVSVEAGHGEDIHHVIDHYVGTAVDMR